MASRSGDEADLPATKKRRIPKACASCRRSKLRCDERRPCSRCVNAGAECIYHAKPKDPLSERLEDLEAQLSGLQGRLNAASPMTDFNNPSLRHAVRQSHRDTTVASSRNVDNGANGLACFNVRKISGADVVHRGLVAEADAISLFHAFFQG